MRSILRYCRHLAESGVACFLLLDSLTQVDIRSIESFDTNGIFSNDSANFMSASYHSTTTSQRRAELLISGTALRFPPQLLIRRGILSIILPRVLFFSRAVLAYECNGGVQAKGLRQEDLETTSLYR